MKRILIVNGPNLNLLGTREPDVYGNTSFDDYHQQLIRTFPKAQIDYYQSNHEGELVEKIQQTDGVYDAVVINPGGYTHTSVAIADALRSVRTMAIEVHISHIGSREHFREQSITMTGCDGMVAGLGLDSYRLAIEHILDL